MIRALRPRPDFLPPPTSPMPAIEPVDVPAMSKKVVANICASWKSKGSPPDACDAVAADKVAQIERGEIIDFHEGWPEPVRLSPADDQTSGEDVAPTAVVLPDSGLRFAGDDQPKTSDVVPPKFDPHWGEKIEPTSLMATGFLQTEMPDPYETIAEAKDRLWDEYNDLLNKSGGGFATSAEAARLRLLSANLADFKKDKA